MSSNTPDWSLCGYFSLYLASISRLEYFVLIIPCLATIAAEFANKKRRGPMLTAAFSMQDWGTISAYIVAIIFLSIFQGVMNADNQRIGSHLAYSFCVYQIILFLNIVFQLKCSSTGHRYYPLFCCMHLILGPLFGSTEMTSNCKQKRKLLLILFAVGLRIDAHNRRGDRRYMEHRRYQLVCMINDYKSSQIYATWLLPVTRLKHHKVIKGVKKLVSNNGSSLCTNIKCPDIQKSMNTRNKDVQAATCIAIASQSRLH